MNPSAQPLTIRPGVDADIEGMRTLLNSIIRIGGTTATLNERSPDDLAAKADEWQIEIKNLQVAQYCSLVLVDV